MFDVQVHFIFVNYNIKQTIISLSNYQFRNLPAASLVVKPLETDRRSGIRKPKSTFW